MVCPLPDETQRITANTPTNLPDGTVQVEGGRFKTSTSSGGGYWSNTGSVICPSNSSYRVVIGGTASSDDGHTTLQIVSGDAYFNGRLSVYDRFRVGEIQDSGGNGEIKTVNGKFWQFQYCRVSIKQDDDGINALQVNGPSIFHGPMSGDSWVWDNTFNVLMLDTYLDTTERVVNGTFDSSLTGWTTTLGFTWSSGTAAYSGSTLGQLTRPISVPAGGGWFKYSYTITNYSGSRPHYFFAYLFSAQSNTGNGTFTGYFYLPDNNSSYTWGLVVAGSGAASLNVDNISVKKVLLNNSTSGNNPAQFGGLFTHRVNAVRVDATDLYQNGNRVLDTTSSVGYATSAGEAAGNSGGSFFLSDHSSSSAYLSFDGSSGGLVFQIHDNTAGAGPYQAFMMSAKFQIYSGPLQTYLWTGDVGGTWSTGGTIGYVGFDTGSRTMNLGVADDSGNAQSCLSGLLINPSSNPIPVGRSGSALWFLGDLTNAYNPNNDAAAICAGISNYNFTQGLRIQSPDDLTLFGLTYDSWVRLGGPNNGTLKVDTYLDSTSIYMNNVPSGSGSGGIFKATAADAVANGWTVLCHN